MSTKFTPISYISLLLLLGIGCATSVPRDEAVSDQTPLDEASSVVDAVEDSQPEPVPEEELVVCSEPTSIPVSTSDLGGGIYVDKISVNPYVGNVASDIGGTVCPSDACLVLPPLDFVKAAPPSASSLSFSFTRNVEQVSFTVCDSSVALEAHGYVDTPGAQEDEVRTLDATGESICAERSITFDPPVQRLTVRGNDSDEDKTWGVDDILVTWACD
ncbi:hypothetical protein EPN81_04665 [Patescibacteria group bacterium]|nr:MAG: hypothetical protein EPN81_04665 [Patescibacteria group bacterium]